MVIELYIKIRPYNGKRYMMGYFYFKANHSNTFTPNPVIISIKSQ